MKKDMDTDPTNVKSSMRMWNLSLQMFHLHFPISETLDGDSMEEDNLWYLFDDYLVSYASRTSTSSLTEMQKDKMAWHEIRRRDVFTHNRERGWRVETRRRWGNIQIFCWDHHTLCKQFCVTLRRRTRNLQSIIPPVWLMLFNILSMLMLLKKLIIWHLHHEREWILGGIW